MTNDENGREAREEIEKNPESCADMIKRNLEKDIGTVGAAEYEIRSLFTRRK